jgi:hypothetical protein
MRTRREYDEAFRIVRTAIARWDPHAILEGGAPADEWDSEVARLLPLIQRALTSADVARQLANVFGARLGGASIPVDECSSVAVEILVRLKTAGLLDP